MNKIFEVSILTRDCSGCFLPPLGGIFAWVPSRTSHFLGDPSDGNKMDSGHGVSIMIGFNFE